MIGTQSDTLYCEYPTCHHVGQVYTARLWPCGDVIEYVRCNMHRTLDAVVPVVRGRRVSTMRVTR